MSSTNFWFDRHGNCKNPGQAIAYLQDTQSRTYLSDFWSGFQIPRSIDLQNQALLMMGITDNLQAALLRDYNNGNGIGAVQTAGPGSLKIAYVRRRAGIETKSVVIIADFNLDRRLLGRPAPTIGLPPRSCARRNPRRLRAPTFARARRSTR